MILLFSIDVNHNSSLKFIIGFENGISKNVSIYFIQKSRAHIGSYYSNLENLYNFWFIHDDEDFQHLDKNSIYEPY